MAGYDACAFLKRREGLSCATSPLRHQATDPTPFLGHPLRGFQSTIRRADRFQRYLGLFPQPRASCECNCQPLFRCRSEEPPAFGCRRRFAPKESTLATRNQTKDYEWRTTVCLRLTARRNSLCRFQCGILRRAWPFSRCLSARLPRSAAVSS